MFNWRLATITFLNKLNQPEAYQYAHSQDAAYAGN
jgi:hypothetical protein